MKYVYHVVCVSDDITVSVRARTDYDILTSNGMEVIQLTIEEEFPDLENVVITNVIQLKDRRWWQFWK